MNTDHSSAAPAAASTSASGPVPAPAHAPMAPPAPEHHPAHGRKIFFGALLILAGFGGFVTWRILRPSPLATTDDARVMAHYTTVAPRIATQVTAVHVKDNQFVHKGDLLVELDDRDLQTAKAHVLASIARDQAQVADTQAAIARQPSLIAQAASAVDAARARLALARQNAQRYRNLAQTGAGTVQNRQQADAGLQQAEAELQGAEAGLAAARQQLQVLRASQQAAQAQVVADQSQLQQAELNLQYTRITAPIDGTVGQLAVEVGNYATVGNAMMTLVPLDAVYIESDYREIQLRHVLAGQPVDIHLDAYDVTLKGRVDSIAPASGATFSAIPPENATGNFTKIVQRIPVKITVLPGQPAARLLRLGMNVETTIQTNYANVLSAQAVTR